VSGLHIHRLLSSSEPSFSAPIVNDERITHSPIKQFWELLLNEGRMIMLPWLSLYHVILDLFLLSLMRFELNRTHSERIILQWDPPAASERGPSTNMHEA